MRFAEFGDDGRQFGHGGGGEVMVVGDQEQIAGAGDAFEQLPHILFGRAARLEHVAHARRVVGLGVKQSL